MLLGDGITNLQWQELYDRLDKNAVLKAHLPEWVHHYTNRRKVARPFEPHCALVICNIIVFLKHISQLAHSPIKHEWEGLINSLNECNSASTPPLFLDEMRKSHASGEVIPAEFVRKTREFEHIYALLFGRARYLVEYLESQLAGEMLRRLSSEQQVYFATETASKK